MDLDANAIDHVRKLSASLMTGLPQENFQVAPIERMPFADGFADVVICSSVLHFARDEEHFQSMLAELWRACDQVECCSADWGQGSAWISREWEEISSSSVMVRNGFWLTKRC